MELAQFCASSRIVVVAGKGGVGKTTVVAVLATMAARTGASVLVVEVEGKSGLASCLGLPPLRYDEVDAGPGMRVRALSADAALLEYLRDRNLQRLSARLVRSGTLDVVATAVPGLRDLLLLGKVKQIEQSRDAPDLIVVDSPAAGHAITFLGSPRGLHDAVRVGAIGQQAGEVAEMLSDPSRCQVLLVTLPEETPVNEVTETAFALEERVGVALGPVVLNQCIPDRWCDAPGPGTGVTADGVDLPVAEADALDAAAGFVAARRRVERTQMARLAAQLPLPQVRLPFVAREVDREVVEELADVFAAQVRSLKPFGDRVAEANEGSQ